VAEGEARAALKEAAELQEQERWPEALSAARRAKGVLAGFRPDPELWQQVEQRNKDLEMVLQLEEARFQITGVYTAALPSLGGARVPFDWGASGPAYTAAFEWYGLDVDHLDPREAARPIQEGTIRIQLAAALDDWAFMRRNLGIQGWRQLLAITRLADPDPWRDRLRDAMEGDDPSALAKVAKAAPGAGLPPTTAVLLSRLTYGTPAAEQAAICLRQAWQRRPTDFSVNLELSLCLFKLSTISGAANRGNAHQHAMAAVALRPQSPGAHLQLATMLQFASQVHEAIAECQEAVRLKNDCPGAHRRLGILYGVSGQLDRSIAEYREAIRLGQGDWTVHSNLGENLIALGQLDDAIQELQEAIRLDPDVPECHCRLGGALKAKALLLDTTAKLRERLLQQAIAAYQAGILLGKGHHPQDRALIISEAVKAHMGLGDALRLTNRLDDAIAEYQKAISIQVHPGYFGLPSDELREVLHLDKGESTALYIIWDAVAEVLAGRGQRIDACGMYGAIGLLTESLAEAYRSLGTAFQAKGEREKALAAFRQGIQLKKDTAYVHYKAGNLAMADGRAPATSGEYRIAVLFYEDAFAADPKPVDEARAQHRYTAACAAVLAASIPETEAAPLDGSKQRKWRQLALSWLRDDLEAWDRLLEREPDKAPIIAGRLHHWQQASDFASVRGREALARLPEDERAAWEKLWVDVAATLVRAQKQLPAELRSGTK
jgi:tetratricopeptide (TPR) repeat protein